MNARAGNTMPCVSERARRKCNGMIVLVNVHVENTMAYANERACREYNGVR